MPRYQDTNLPKKWPAKLELNATNTDIHRRDLVRKQNNLFIANNHSPMKKTSCATFLRVYIDYEIYSAQSVLFFFFSFFLSFFTKFFHGKKPIFIVSVILLDFHRTSKVGRYKRKRKRKKVTWRRAHELDDTRDKWRHSRRDENYVQLLEIVAPVQTTIYVWWIKVTNRDVIEETCSFY